MATTLQEARTLRDEGQDLAALAAYAWLIEKRSDPGLVAEAAEVALRVEPPLAEQLARSALRHAPTLAVARHHLGEALAAQGRFAEALRELRAAVAGDGRVADLRHPGAAPWTEAPADRPCPACGGEDRELVWVGNVTRTQTLFGVMDPVKAWARCRGCGLVHTPAVPDEDQLADHVEARRARGAWTPPDPHAVARECLHWEPVLERIARHVGKGTLLEAGSSWGVFLAAAEWHGFRVVGVEPLREAADHARERFGLPVRLGAVPDDLPDGTYDVVVSWDGVQRLADPDAGLAALAARVRPGGVLALSTPDLDHPAHRVAGPDDPQWSAPANRVWYDRATLAAALARVGFEPIERWFATRHPGSVATLARPR